MKNYLNVVSRIANTPLLIDKDKLSVLTSNVVLKLLQSEKLDDGGFTPTNRQVDVNTIQSKVAIIKVFDTLVSKNGIGASGCTTYESINAQILSLIDAKVETIGFYIDSPGGEAKGLFNLVDFIHSIPTVYGIKTFSFVEGSATSAAYAIASSTQEIYSTKDSNLGSIAAIMSLVDVTEADKQNGISYTIIRSKEEKALYSPHEKISDKVIEKATKGLDVIDTMFNNAVSKFRPNLTLEVINSLKGASFYAEEALKLGLVDEIVPSLDEAVKKYGTSSSKTNPSTSRGSKMATLEELNAQISALVTENNTLKDGVASSITKAVEQERNRCSEIIKAGAELKINSDVVLKRINSGSCKDDALDIFTAIAEVQASLSSIDTSTSPAATIKKPETSEQLTFDGLQVNVSDILSAAKGVK